MNDLAITISGLCLVELKADKGDRNANAGRVWIPPADEHVPRLIFRHVDLHEGAEDIQLDRFYGPAGEDLLALPLSGLQAEFELTTDSTQVGMDWAPEDTNRPISEGAMDWLINSEDLGLDTGNLPGITSHIDLPPGRLRAKNIILKDDGTKILLWRYDGENKRKHALADDMLLLTPIKDTVVKFKWQHGGKEHALSFFREDRKTLELCIANDDATISNFDLAEGENPHEHLKMLAVALGQDENELDIPYEDDDQLTGGRICTQAVYFSGKD